MTILAPLLPAALAGVLGVCLPLLGLLLGDILTGPYAETEDLA